MIFEEGIGLRAARPGKVPMWLITEGNIAEESKGGGITFVFGAQCVARKTGRGGISGIREARGEDLDFAARGFEPVRLTTSSLDLGILSIASLNVSSDTTRMRAQFLRAKA